MKYKVGDLIDDIKDGSVYKIINIQPHRYRKNEFDFVLMTWASSKDLPGNIIEVTGEYLDYYGFELFEGVDGRHLIPKLPQSTFEREMLDPQFKKAFDLTIKYGSLNYRQINALNIVRYVYSHLSAIKTQHSLQENYNIIREADAEHLNKYGCLMYQEEYYLGELTDLEEVLNEGYSVYEVYDLDHITEAQKECLDKILALKELKQQGFNSPEHVLKEIQTGLDQAKAKLTNTFNETCNQLIDSGALSNPQTYTKREATPVKLQDPWYHLCVGEGFDFYISQMGTGRIEYGNRHENVILLSKEQMKSLSNFIDNYKIEIFN